jgi:flavin reductase (DIM6/NTAB) family NADH-FMN oxidoreductase RutF
VAASWVNFECKVADIVQLKGYKGGLAEAWLVLGEVVGVHIAPAALKDGLFDTFGAGILLRAGGPTAYAVISPETRLDMERPG